MLLRLLYKAIVEPWIKSKPTMHIKYDKIFIVYKNISEYVMVYISQNVNLDSDI